MDIHHYHFETGEYLGVSLADTDPLDPSRSLIPAFATELEPPVAQEGHARVFNANAWSQIADHRGETWWDAAGRAAYVDFLGDPAEHGLTNVAPPDPVPEEISRRQFYQGLAVAGMITKAEAISAIQGAALPAALKVIVDGMVDDDAAFEATMLLLGAGSFFRSHPLVLVFAMAQAMTETEVDDFWRLCAAL